MKKGVPQGSILGPLLYILYTNELPLLTKGHVVMYADDTSIIMNSDEKDVLGQHLGGVLDGLQQCFSSNNLLMNVEKKQIMKFTTKRNEISTFKIKHNNVDTADNVDHF